MMKILVTGAGGYIGRHVVRELLCRKDVDVYAASRSVANIDKRANLIQTDIFDPSIELYKKIGHLDACIHMAWRDGFIHNSPSHLSDFSSHYVFCRNLINSGLRKLAVIGSMHEVGYWEGLINGNTPCNPQSLYGIAKNSLRQSLFFEAKDITMQWLRSYYIYGDDINNHSIFTKLIQAEKAGQLEFPFTSGKNKYDFIHVEMLAKQIVATVMQDKINGIIECCSGKPKSLAEQVESFIKHHSLRIKLKYGAYPDRSYDSPGAWGDYSKIKEIMGA